MFYRLINNDISLADDAEVVEASSLLINDIIYMNEQQSG